MNRTISRFMGLLSRPFTLLFSERSVDPGNSTNLAMNFSGAVAPSNVKKQIYETVVDASQNSAGTGRSLDLLSSTKERPNRGITINPNDIQCLRALLEDEICENGIKNPSEKFFCRLLEKDRNSALYDISKLYLENYSTDTKKINIAVGILHLLSHLDYEQIYPTGQLLALTAIQHKYDELAEYGIKCYENWGNADGVETLKAVRFSSDWLQEYAKQIIYDLSEGE